MFIFEHTLTQLEVTQQQKIGEIIRLWLIEGNTNVIRAKMRKIYHLTHWNVQVFTFSTKKHVFSSEKPYRENPKNVHTKTIQLDILPKTK